MEFIKKTLKLSILSKLTIWFHFIIESKIKYKYILYSFLGICRVFKWIFHPFYCSFYVYVDIYLDLLLYISRIYLKLANKYLDSLFNFIKTLNVSHECFAKYACMYPYVYSSISVFHSNDFTRIHNFHVPKTSEKPKILFINACFMQ